tara:strand:+ start:2058 stop:2306 length:249 start_codon:yes stop_codon:yes gene_type:complete
MSKKELKVKQDLVLAQTLVIGKDENRKFYGHIDGIGWCTSSTPISTFILSITMEQLKQIHEGHDFTDVRLVKVKMQIIDEEI